jgi:hypothetical protein
MRIVGIGLEIDRRAEVFRGIGILPAKEFHAAKFGLGGSVAGVDTQQILVVGDAIAEKPFSVIS